MKIQWFPGHMTRAKREIQEKLKLIDLAIELLDARLPFSSQNPMLQRVLQHKKRLVILTKADLADPVCTQKWISYFEKQGIVAIALNINSPHNVTKIVEVAQKILKPQMDLRIQKGMKPRAIRTMIVGIPNVGKSTLINSLVKRQVAKTGDRPGVTKGQQWIKLADKMELLDTPGILWPKFEDQNVGFRLAAMGSIREEILPVEEIAFYIIKFLKQQYPEAILNRYQVSAEDPVETMEEIGRRRGCLLSQGRVDLEKASRAILNDLQDGKLGRITLEIPQS